MSKLLYSRSAIAVASLLCATAALAQQATAQQRANEAGAQVNQAGHGQSTANQSGVTVTEAIAKKLMKVNESEIALAKMVHEKSDSDELKAFTQMIIKDHEALNTELKKCCDMPGSDRVTRSQADGHQAKSGQDNRTETSSNQAEHRQDNQSQTGTNRIDGKEYEYVVSHSAMVPQELCDIGEQACENALKMTKEMLSKYEGEEFEMAYLGQQCVAHTIMLAELKAIESNGPRELREVATKASKKVEAHLEKAKSLAKERQEN